MYPLPHLHTFRLRRVQARPGTTLLVHDHVGEGGRGGIAGNHSGNVHPLLFQPLQDQPPVGVRADFCREARVQAEPAGAARRTGRTKTDRTRPTCHGRSVKSNVGPGRGCDKAIDPARQPHQRSKKRGEVELGELVCLPRRGCLPRWKKEQGESGTQQLRANVTDD